MKRALLVLLALLIVTAGFAQQQKARTPADYVKELMDPERCRSGRS